MVERGTFTPLVLTTTGGMSDECQRYHSRLAELLAVKKEKNYASTITWIRTRVSFAILRSASVRLRGSRPWRRTTPIFFSFCRCCCLFVFSFLKRERHFEFQSYDGAWHRATLSSANLFKIIRWISQVREVSSLLISYNITISWLYPLNGFRIIFFCFRIAWQYNQELFCWGQLIH